jgi:hypothetical protein
MTSGDHGKQFESDLLCEAINSNAFDAPALPNALRKKGPLISQRPLFTSNFCPYANR